VDGIEGSRKGIRVSTRWSRILPVPETGSLAERELGSGQARKEIATVKGTMGFGAALRGGCLIGFVQKRRRAVGDVTNWACPDSRVTRTVLGYDFEFMRIFETPENTIRKSTCLNE
jgi:hypothetical protein